MLKAPAEPVQLPDRDNIQFALAGIFQHCVKRRSGLLCSRNSFVDVFAMNSPAPLPGNLPKFIKLHINVLPMPCRRYAPIQCRPNNLLVVLNHGVLHVHCLDELLTCAHN